MGEIADAIIEGEMCEDCGCFFEDGAAPGFPRSCCKPKKKKKKKLKKYDKEVNDCGC